METITTTDIRAANGFVAHVNELLGPLICL